MFNTSFLPNFAKRGLGIGSIRSEIVKSRERLFSSRLSAVLRIIRPFSNIKNVAIVFLAYALAGFPASAPSPLWPILALSLVFSATYAFNSLMDVRLDARNRNKRVYASAVESIGTRETLEVALTLVAAGWLLGYFLHPRFFAALIGVVVVALVYSAPPFRFKERVLLDVLFGAALTFPLRFIGSWFVFSATAPPLLPILGLLLGKSGAYILYKELDRDELLATHLRTTTTTHSRARNVGIALTMLALSITAFSAMVFTHDVGLSWLGTAPKSALILLPLSIPPLVGMILQATGVTNFHIPYLKALGFLYVLLVILLSWRFF